MADDLVVNYERVLNVATQIVADNFGKRPEWMVEMCRAYLERDAQLASSEAARMRMDSALTAAASVFRHYEKLHFSKEPPDLDKAQRNRDMALVCENARDLAKDRTDGR